MTRTMEISFGAEGMARVSFEDSEWLLTDSQRTSVIGELDGDRLWWLTAHDDPELLVARFGQRSDRKT